MSAPTSSASSGRLYLDALKNALALAEQHQAELLQALSNEERPVVTNALQSLLDALLPQNKTQRPSLGQDASSGEAEPSLKRRRPDDETEAATVNKSKTALLAREGVLLNQHLLMQIFHYVVVPAGAPGDVTTRKTLGVCALVNKSWKTASRVDLLWRPIFTHLLPAAAEILSPSTTRAENEYTYSFIRYGMLLAERKKLLVDADDQLTMHMEIFDSCDQFRYLSSVGRLHMWRSLENNLIISN